jgi:hypothetical protein
MVFPKWDKTQGVPSGIQTLERKVHEDTICV